MRLTIKPLNVILFKVLKNNSGGGENDGNNYSYETKNENP